MEDLGVGAQSAKELLDAMSRFQQMVDDFDRKVQQMKTERDAAELGQNTRRENLKRFIT